MFFFQQASLDEPTGTVVLHRTEPTRLQTLALQLSEKINTLMDHTERIAQIKSGEMGTQFNRNQRMQNELVALIFSIYFCTSCLEGQPQQNQQQGNYKQQGNWKGGNKGKGNQSKFS